MSDKAVSLALDPDALRVRDLFNQVAPTYDDFNNRLSFGQHHIWKQMAVKWSQAFPGATCVDLCCGSGDIAQRLGRQVGPRGKVYGVDFSHALLEVAYQRAQRYFPDLPIIWAEEDVLDLPFADNFFDAATMGYGLRNVTDVLESLVEIQRVLKPGSTLAALDFHRPSNPLVQAFQNWYLETIVVPTAQHLDLAAEYAYIGPSLAKFPRGSEQVELAYQAGFERAVHYPISNGMMGILVATKGTG